MCVVNITEISILDDDLIAYKLVRSKVVQGVQFNQNMYFSRYSPIGRITQVRFKENDKYYFYPLPRGGTLVYKIGEKTTSNFKTSPGLYCYASKEALLEVEESLAFEGSILEVLIPKGTKIKRAKSSKLANYEDVILAEELIPVKEIKV